MARIAHLISGLYLVLALIVTGITAVAGPLPGGAPPLPIFDPGEIVVTIAYGTEKEEWLQAATERFQVTNQRVNGRAIRIELEGIGSREMVQEIIAGDLQPVVISPASSIQIELLEDQWQTRNQSSILLQGDHAPQALVVTPLVVVAWEERADVLSFNNPAQLWNNLHDVLSDSQGWGAFEHSEWGLAKFGQTNPETSNSGIQALVLQAYAYHDKATGLTNEDILDPDFQAWLDQLQEAVLEFPDSTGTLMEDVVRFGPSQYDFVVVYENLAIGNIETAEGRWGPISVYYPPANILSDHPYAILNAEWVSPDQRAAAASFREFLLSEDIQELALEFGFRPASPTVAFDTPDSPFTQYESYGIQTDISQSVEIPSANVLEGLIDFWRRQDYE